MVSNTSPLATSVVKTSGSDTSDPDPRTQLGTDCISARLDGDAPWQDGKEAEGDNIVDWDGPDDPDNPLNWPGRKSFGHVIIVAVLSMVV